MKSTLPGGSCLVATMATPPSIFKERNVARYVVELDRGGKRVRARQAGELERGCNSNSWSSRHGQKRRNLQQNEGRANKVVSQGRGGVTRSGLRRILINAGERNKKRKEVGWKGESTRQRISWCIGGKRRKVQHPSWTAASL